MKKEEKDTIDLIILCAKVGIITIIAGLVAIVISFILTMLL